MTVTYSDPGSGVIGCTRRCQKGELAVITEPAKTFTRVFRGYDPAAVDAHVEMLTTKQRLLLDDVESLRFRLKESGNEAAALRKEVAVLTDTSPSPHAVQQRMSKMLRRAVDEVSEMQAEARAEADALIAAAQAEVEASQRKREELLADMAAQRKALEAECKETKETLEGKKLSLGIRPEHVRLATSGPSVRLAAVVNIVENLGSENFVHAEIAENQLLVAKIPGGPAPERNHRLPLFLPAEHLYLFDEQEKVIPTSPLIAPVGSTKAESP